MRRLLNLIELVFIAALLLSQTANCTPSPIQLTTKDLPEYGLRLIPQSDETFDGRLRAAIGVRSDPVIEVSKPVTVIRENQSATDAIAYALSWSWLDDAGQPRRHAYFFESLAAGRDMVKI